MFWWKWLPQSFSVLQNFTFWCRCCMFSIKNLKNQKTFHNWCRGVNEGRTPPSLGKNKISSHINILQWTNSPTYIVKNIIKPPPLMLHAKFLWTTKFILYKQRWRITLSVCKRVDYIQRYNTICCRLFSMVLKCHRCQLQVSYHNKS